MDPCRRLSTKSQCHLAYTMASSDGLQTGSHSPPGDFAVTSFWLGKSPTRPERVHQLNSRLVVWHVFQALATAPSF